MEHEPKTHRSQEEADQKHRLRQNESPPPFDQFHSFDHDMVETTETRFNPVMDEHAALLANAPSHDVVSNIMFQLQKNYGNSYVQRLVKSTEMLANSTSHSPKSVYWNEAYKTADRITNTTSSEIQLQVEEEDELQAKSLLQRQDMDEDQEEIQMQPDDDQTVDLLEEPQISKSSGGLSVIQREWAPEDVNEALKIGAKGVRAKLKRGNYKIYKFAALRMKKRVGLEESEGSLHGYHCRLCRIIGIKADETPNAAAATIVHEAQHAQQYEEKAEKSKEDWSILKREFEAHIREEQFRKANKEPPKIPEFRDEDNNIDIKAIKEWVASNYGEGSVMRLYPSGHPKDGQPISMAVLKHIHNLATDETEVNIW